MILADTSIWVDHFRPGVPLLAALLEQGNVMIHPFVVGELACGTLKSRVTVLRLLRELPKTPVATDPEVLAYIDRHALMGRGIGYVDVHLLAAATLADGARLGRATSGSPRSQLG